jgi:T5orf172 domain
MIYFARIELKGDVKIGYTDDTSVDRRLTELRRHYGDVFFDALMPGNLADEQRLHRQFADGHLGHEWFRADTPGLQQAISDAIQREAMLTVTEKWPI